MYRKQLEAPTPIPIISNVVPPKLPPFLGRDYHGEISHIEAAALFESKSDGAYLVRSSKIANGQFYTLSLK